MLDNLIFVDTVPAVSCSKNKWICKRECEVSLLNSIETSASKSNQVRITKESDLSIDLELLEEEYYRLEKGGYYDGLC